MKEFEISDKELKALLHAEGVEEPSMSFNKSVISKIEAFEAKKAEPVRAPKWVLVVLAFLFIAPTAYFILSGQVSLTGDNAINLELPSPDLGISSKFVMILVLAVMSVGMALLFDRMLRQQSLQKTQVKKS
jgi:hypothetical protein